MRRSGAATHAVAVAERREAEAQPSSVKSLHAAAQRVLLISVRDARARAVRVQRRRRAERKARQNPLRATR